MRKMCLGISGEGGCGDKKQGCHAGMAALLYAFWAVGLMQMYAVQERLGMSWGSYNPGFLTKEDREKIRGDDAGILQRRIQGGEKNDFSCRNFCDAV